MIDKCTGHDGQGCPQNCRVTRAELENGFGTKIERQIQFRGKDVDVPEWVCACGHAHTVHPGGSGVGAVAPPAPKLAQDSRSSGVVDSHNSSVDSTGSTSRKRERESGFDPVSAQWEATVYKAVIDATKNISCKPFELIEKDTDWFGMSDTRLFVRDWHTKFWASYKDRIARGPRSSSSPAHRVAIIGTPGIGKTVALNYILRQYLKMASKSKEDAERGEVCLRRYVALIIPNERKWWCFDTETQMAVCVSGSPVFSLGFEKEVLVLHDLGKDKPVVSNDIPTVLATSPNIAKYNEFLKGSQNTFYAPLYTDEEMRFAAKYLFPGVNYGDIIKDAKDWNAVAFYFGNVPRDVFVGGNSAFSSLEQQLQVLRMTDLDENALSELCNEQQTMQINDRLVYHEPSDDFSSSKLYFRKGYVAQEMAKVHIFSKLSRWSDIVRFTNNGHVFETVMHEFLGSFPHLLDLTKVRPLKEGQGQPGGLPEQVRELWPKKGWRQTVFCQNTRVELQTQHYYYPRKPNFAVVDSFVFSHRGNAKTADLLCFQMTIADEHKPTATKLRAFVDDFSKSFCFREKGLSMRVDDDGKATLESDSTTLFSLQLHLFFVTQGNNQFTYQSLVEEPSSSKWSKFWKRVAQYETGPPTFTENS